MNQVLAELKEVFNLYSPLWSDWIKYRNCGLSPDDIYILNIHVKNNFQISIEHLVTFYNRASITKQLVQKLKLQYNAFKEWVTQRFINSLLYKGVKYNWNTFFITPIPDLFLSAALKKGLLEFNVRAVVDIIKILVKEKSIRDILFENVLQCQAILAKEERQQLKYKMEVIKDI